MAYLPRGQRGRGDVQAACVSISVARMAGRGGLREDLELVVLVQVGVSAAVEQQDVADEALGDGGRHGAAVEQPLHALGRVVHGVEDEQVAGAVGAPLRPDDRERVRAVLQVQRRFGRPVHFGPRAAAAVREVRFHFVEHDLVREPADSVWALVVHLVVALPYAAWDSQIFEECDSLNISQ